MLPHDAVVFRMQPFNMFHLIKTTSYGKIELRLNYEVSAQR